jgi:hypothetical protein
MDGISPFNPGLLFSTGEDNPDSVSHMLALPARKGGTWVDEGGIPATGRAASLTAPTCSAGRMRSTATTIFRTWWSTRQASGPRRGKPTA